MQLVMHDPCLPSVMPLQVQCIEAKAGVGARVRVKENKLVLMRGWNAAEGKEWGSELRLGCC
jgi:hypothetical protein